MSSASLAKPGIFDVVRKMLKMFILVLCMESLHKRVWGMPFSLYPGQGSAASLPPFSQLPGRLLLQPASCMASPLGHITACPAGPIGTKATPRNLWSSWIQVSGPSHSGKLFLATSACFHACIMPPLPQGACSGGWEPQALGPRQ